MSRYGAGVAQLAERQLPKLNVTGSSPVARSILFCSQESRACIFFGWSFILLGEASRVDPDADI